MNEVYVLRTPCSEQQTWELIDKALTALKGKRKNNVCSWQTIKRYGIFPAKVKFFMKEADDGCRIRSFFTYQKEPSRRFWNDFILTLIEQNPGIDFGVKPGKPYKLLAVLDMNGDTEVVNSSYTTGGTSMAGFLLGGAAFGTAGAIVGGTSGRQHSVGSSQTVFSDQINARLLWSDGMIEEKIVKKKSDLYQEIILMTQE